MLLPMSLMSFPGKLQEWPFRWVSSHIPKIFSLFANDNSSSLIWAHWSTRASSSNIVSIHLTFESLRMSALWRVMMNIASGASCMVSGIKLKWHRNSQRRSPDRRCSSRSSSVLPGRCLPWGNNIPQQGLHEAWYIGRPWRTIFDATAEDLTTQSSGPASASLAHRGVVKAKARWSPPSLQVCRELEHAMARRLPSIPQWVVFLLWGGDDSS
jgi:hypothetical protein